jgi:DNA-binding MarR family transcriptional regulator
MPGSESAQSPLSDRERSLTLLRALVASLTRSARAVESTTGLTNAQLFLLRQTARRNEISINELAALARIRQNGVSAVVTGLVKAGMLQKVRSPADQRRAALSLTAKGRRTLTRAPVSGTEALIAGLEALDSGDLRALVRGLTALITILRLEPDRAPMLFEPPTPRARRKSS